MQQSPTPRVIKYSLALMLALTICFLLFINSGLASLVNLFAPGSALWAHLALMGVEALALVWVWRALFRGRKRLQLSPDASPEERKTFAAVLARRMMSNPRIRAAGIMPVSSEQSFSTEYLERCLDFLNQQADEEIRRNARRIFLATALSQNGRLDALIVFVSLCRLIWRISDIYNHRPHPGEITSLYWAVASSVFLAFSIEELDLSTEITVGFGEAFHAMAPAGMADSIPFAGKALQTFTAATIDGASNCYLALRTGIITRNCYAYALNPAERPGRAAVFREAGALLLGMSHELVGKVAAAVAEGITQAARNVAISAGHKTVRVGKGIVDSVGQVGHEIGSGAGKLASNTVNAVDRLATGVADTAIKATTGAGKLAGDAARTAARGGRALLRIPGKAAGGAGKLLALPGRLLRRRPKAD
jgi:hypothetical protein